MDPFKHEKDYATLKCLNIVGINQLMAYLMQPYYFINAVKANKPK